jgi:hypothetical protein
MGVFIVSYVKLMPPLAYGKGSSLFVGVILEPTWT